MWAPFLCFFSAEKYLNKTFPLLLSSHFRGKREPFLFQGLFSSWVLESRDSHSCKHSIMHSPFSVLHLLFLSMLLFLLTLHYIKTSNFLTYLLSFSAIYQHHAGSLLSLLSLDVIVHHFEHVFIASSIPLPHGPSAPSSQQIPSWINPLLIFSAITFHNPRFLLTQDIKENPQLCWLVPIPILASNLRLSRGNNPYICPSLLNTISHFPC